MRQPVLSPYFEIIEWIFICQFLFIGAHLAFALVLTPMLSFFSRRREQKIATLTEKLLQCIQERIEWATCRFPRRLRKISFFIPVIAKIDRESREDPYWSETRKAIFEAFLLPQAEKLTYSRKWTQRIQAVGCFLFFPDLRTEPHILHLLADSTPMIQYSAAFCAAKLGTPRCANGIIDAMNRADRFLRHPFREALLKGDQRSFAHLEKRLESDPDPFAKVSCLEILSQRMNSHIADLAQRDLYAPNKNLRIAAIRALGHFSDPVSTSSLIPLLKDGEWEVRAIAARALGYLRAKEALSELSLLLKDEIWWVRMNGALALKRLGEEGKKVLEQQDPQKDQSAHEIAQYVLALDLYE